jgi:hypothetical protein
MMGDQHSRTPASAAPLAGVESDTHYQHTPTVQSHAQVRAAPAASVCRALLGRDIKDVVYVYLHPQSIVHFCKDSYFIAFLFVYPFTLLSAVCLIYRLTWALV